jgi:hypothetical protein
MTLRIGTTDGILEHYRGQSAYSTAGTLASLYDDLPDDIPDLFAALHRTILRMFWIGEKTYGITYERLKAADRRICVEFSCSSAEERLRNIVDLDNRPLSEPRESNSRSVGCCRDYALMLVSIRGSPLGPNESRPVLRCTGRTAHRGPLHHRASERRRGPLAADRSTDRRCTAAGDREGPQHDRPAAQPLPRRTVAH